MLLFVTNMVTINFYWTISLNFILRCVSSPGTLPAPVLLRYCSVPVNAPFTAFSRRSFLLPEKQKRVNQRPDLSFSMRHRPQFNIPFALGTNATARPILLAAGNICSGHASCQDLHVFRVSILSIHIGGSHVAGFNRCIKSDRLCDKRITSWGPITLRRVLRFGYFIHKSINSSKTGQWHK